MKCLILLLIFIGLSTVWAGDECLQSEALDSHAISDIEEMVEAVNPSVVYIELDVNKFKKSSPSKTKKFVEEYFRKKNIIINSLLDSERVSSLYMLNKNYKLKSTLFFLDSIEEKAAKKIQSHSLVKSVSFKNGYDGYAKYEIKLVRSVYEKELDSILGLVPAGFNRRYSAVRDTAPEKFKLSVDIETNEYGAPLTRQEALELVAYLSGMKSEGILSAVALYRNTYEIKL